MSADNGIYIAEFPGTDANRTAGRTEYRVAYASAIDNVDLTFMGNDPNRRRLEDAYRVLIFGDAQIFFNEEEAILYAHRMAKDFVVLEYGVSCLGDMRRPLPKMTQEEAYEIIRG